MYKDLNITENNLPDFFKTTVKLNFYTNNFKQL